MADVVGVRFRQAGKIYHFDPAGIELNMGDWVVVETARGQELGQVVVKTARDENNEANKNLKPVLRQNGLLTRDSRTKERKKAGLKRARKAPQYTKR